jgi:hypothetical protein
LLDEVRWGRGTRGGCDVDRLEGGVLREALPAVADREMDVAQAELPNRALGGVREFGMTLDRVDLPREQREQGGVVARPSADIQHAVGGR